MTIIKNYVCLIVKKDNRASIQDYAQVPGARVSFAWKLNPKKCLKGDRVSFHESWKSDSFEQGTVIDKFTVGDRYAVVFQPDEAVLRAEHLPEMHSQEKGYFNEHDIGPKTDVSFANPPYQSTNLKERFKTLSIQHGGRPEDIIWSNPDWSQGTKTDQRFRFPGKPGSFRLVDPSIISLLSDLGIKGERGVRVKGDVAITTAGSGNLFQIEKNGCWECAGGNFKAIAGMTMLVLPTKAYREQYPSAPGIVFELSGDCINVTDEKLKQAI
jgi:hypothetical protein